MDIGCLYRIPKKCNLTIQQEHEITSEEQLKAMAHLSLEKRAHIIKERYGLQKFHRTILGILYRKYKITLCKPKYNYAIKESKKDSL